MSARMCLQSFVGLRCLLRKPRDFWTLREVIPRRTRTTRVAIWDPLYGSKKLAECDQFCCSGRKRTVYSIQNKNSIALVQTIFYTSRTSEADYFLLAL